MHYSSFSTIQMALTTMYNYTTYNQIFLYVVIFQSVSKLKSCIFHFGRFCNVLIFSHLQWPKNWWSCKNVISWVMGCKPTERDN